MGRSELWRGQLRGCGLVRRNQPWCQIKKAALKERPDVLLELVWTLVPPPLTFAKLTDLVLSLGIVDLAFFVNNHVV